MRFPRLRRIFSNPRSRRILTGLPVVLCVASSAALICTDVVTGPRRALSSESGSLSFDATADQLSHIRLTRCFGRLLYLAFIFAPCFLLLGVAFLVQSQALWVFAFRTLRFSCSVAGPTFIKLGQWMSTRPDLFPETLCAEMRQLTSQAPAHSFRATERTVCAALNINSLGEVFSEFSKQPVSSGCVGQVHIARLRNSTAKLSSERNADAVAALPFHHRWMYRGFASGNAALGAFLRWLGSVPLLAPLAPPFHLPMWQDVLCPTIKAAGPPPREERQREKDGVFHEYQVAVKVLHPGIRDSFEADLAIIVRVVRSLLAAAPAASGVQWMGLPRAVAEFSRFLLEQTDLQTESNNLVQFRRNFVDVDHVHFPPPVQPYVTRDVLVMRFFHHSEPILPIAAEADAKTRQRIAQFGLHSFLKMLFVDNLMHCDLHPGNILVRTAHAAPAAGPAGLSPTPSRAPPSEPHSSPSTSSAADADEAYSPCVDTPLIVAPELELCIVDAGLVTRLRPSDYEKFLSLFATVAAGDGREGARLMVQLSTDHECDDVSAFEDDMQRLYEELGVANSIPGAAAAFSLRHIQVGPTVHRIMSMVRRHRVTLEGNFTSMVVGIGVIEGLGRTLDPNVNLVDASIPYLLGNMPMQVIDLVPKLLQRHPRLARQVMLGQHETQELEDAIEVSLCPFVSG